ncbi:MAG: pyridoxamine 5'-phosphate oxidase family protein [Specibacter sp.]
MTLIEPAGVEHLAKAQCWELLKSQVVGRLGVIYAGHPEIFPVNYAVHNGSVVFRTSSGTKLAGALHSAQVVFEIDGYDPRAEQAWSVILRGSAQEIPAPSEPLNPTLQPWQTGAKDHVVRIYTLGLSGRRFRVTEPDIWMTPVTDPRRASFE